MATESEKYLMDLVKKNGIEWRRRFPYIHTIGVGSRESIPELEERTSAYEKSVIAWEKGELDSPITILPDVYVAEQMLF